MPKIEDGVQKRIRKAKAETRREYASYDLRGFDKVKKILFWLLAGLFRWLKHYLWSIEVFWLLERLDDIYDFAISLYLYLSLRSMFEREERRIDRMIERYKKRRWRRKKYKIR